jgi:hypothetical protein
LALLGSHLHYSRTESVLAVDTLARTYHEEVAKELKLPFTAEL